MSTRPPARLEYPRTIRVIYDSKTGEVVHTHHVVVLPDAQVPSDEHLDAHAIALASKFSKRSEQTLKVLQVKSEDFDDNATYRVHPETQQLKKVPRKS